MTTRIHHPIAMLDAFIKEATESTKPFGMVDAGKSSQNRKRTRAGQTYSQPTPSTHATQPGIIAAQKVAPPPPVM